MRAKFVFLLAALSASIGFGDTALLQTPFKDQIPSASDVQTLKSRFQGFEDGETVLGAIAKNNETNTDVKIEVKRDKVDTKSYRPKNRVWTWEKVDDTPEADDFLEIANGICQLEPEWHDDEGGKWGCNAAYSPFGVPKYLLHEIKLLPSTETSIVFEFEVLDEFGHWKEGDKLFHVRATRDTDTTDTTVTPLSGKETGVATLDQLRGKITFEALRTYYNKAIDSVKAIIRSYVGTKVALGDGATNNVAESSIAIGAIPTRPVSTHQSNNIAIGAYIDVGGDPDPNSNSHWSLAIGESIWAPKQHNYLIGSKIVALCNSATILGYGAMASDPKSVVIGHGIRPTADRTFETKAEMLAWMKTDDAKTIMLDALLEVKNDPEETTGEYGQYYVKAIRTTMDSTYGWIELYQTTPHLRKDEYIRGRHNWTFGKSHGKGTVTLVAQGNATRESDTTHGLANVYINDESLADLTGIHNGEPVLKPTWKDNKFTEPVLSPADKTIAIGNNAHATETNSSCQAIAIGRDALSAGSATVVVGPNGFAEGAQAIAVGWRANAVGAHSVSIGSALKSGENYYNDDGTINPNSDLQLAEGGYSVAIGYNNKALANDSITIGNGARVDKTATGAVQLGTGTNTEKDTLKFQNVTIVKGGHVVGSVPDPQEVDPTQGGTVTEELEITVQPGSMTTVLPKSNMGPGSEIGVTCNGDRRNYTLFLPNEPEVRAGLPGSIQNEFPDGVKFSVVGPTTFTKLPVKFVMEQPYGKLAVMTVIPLDDGSDWKPVITDCNLGIVIKAGPSGYYKLDTIDTESTKRSLVGTNLQAGTNYVIRYTLASDTNRTAEQPLMLMKDGAAYLSSTYYGYVGSVSMDIPSAYQPQIISEGDKDYVEYDIVYKTVNGEADVFHKKVEVTYVE